MNNMKIEDLPIHTEGDGVVSRMSALYGRQIGIVLAVLDPVTGKAALTSNLPPEEVNDFIAWLSVQHHNEEYTVDESMETKQ